MHHLDHAAGVPSPGSLTPSGTLARHLDSAVDPPLLTIRQFYDRLGGSVGINALRQAVRTGRIKSITVGERKRLIPTSELHAWPLREAEENT